MVTVDNWDQWMCLLKLFLQVQALSARRESHRPVKKPSHLMVDYSQLAPRYKGKQSEQLKFVTKLVHDMFSKKYKVNNLFYL